MTQGVQVFEQPSRHQQFCVLTEADAEALARRLYGLEAGARALPGEFDDNFRLAAADGRQLMLKAMHPLRERALVDLQCAALRRLEERAPHLPLPRVLSTLAGGDVALATGRTGEPRLVWALTWLPGTPLAEARPRSPETLRDLGRLLGEMAGALAGFAPPEAHRDFAWDLARASWIRGSLAGFRSPTPPAGCNHGRAPSDGAPVELRLSRDAALSIDDLPAGQAYAPWLPPDACADVPVNAYVSVAEEGAYFFIAEVDPQKVVVEILDDNNARASDAIGIGSSADLVVTAIAAPPSAFPGAAIELAVTVCNRGQMSSSDTMVEVMASDGAVTAPGMELLLGSAPVLYLPPGQCATSLVPASIGGDGAYRLRAAVDRWNYVSEILEDNNELQGGLIGVGYDADLVVTAVDGPPSGLPGAALELTVRVCNQGQGPSWDASIEVYASADDEIGPPADMPVGWAQVGSLEPTYCADVPVTAYAPGAPGVYVLGVIVDPQRYIQELIESNNTRAGERIGVGYEPDLVVAQVGGPPSAQPGTALAVTARVCNQGQGPSYGATLDVVLSADAEVGDGDMAMGSTPVPMLEPGACHDLSTMVMAQVYAGPYTLGAIVRADGANELIADNNARAGGLLGVGYDPDLVVTAVTGPASAPVNSEIALTVEACNQGQSASYGVALDVVLASDSAIDASDIPVGSAWLDPMVPGACQSLSLPAYPFQPAGRYVLGARVDPMNGSAELFESNNAAAGANIELTPY